MKTLGIVEAGRLCGSLGRLVDNRQKDAPDAELRARCIAALREFETVWRTWHDNGNSGGSDGDGGGGDRLPWG